MNRADPKRSYRAKLFDYCSCQHFKLKCSDASILKYPHSTPQETPCPLKMIGGGTLDADLQGMASIIPSRSHLRTDSIRQPGLRLVTSDPNHRTIDPAAQSAVMACVTASSYGNSELLRKASAAARANGGELHAAFVDSPRNRFGNTRVRAFIDDAVLASYLGAKITWLESSDVVGELLRFAEQSGISRIFVARNRPTTFPRLFGRTVCSELLSRAHGCRVDVVGFEHGN